MSVWISAALAVVLGGVLLRLRYQGNKQRRIAARRRVERPNSHYASEGVRNQQDRERWGRINLPKLHPINQDEVERLLVLVDADGVHVLSPRDRLFLDNMTVPRLG